MIKADIDELLYQCDDLKGGGASIKSEGIKTTLSETNLPIIVEMVDVFKTLFSCIELYKSLFEGDVLKAVQGIEAIENIDIELSQKMIVLGSGGDTSASSVTYTGFSVVGSPSSVRQGGE